MHFERFLRLAAGLPLLCLSVAGAATLLTGSSLAEPPCAVPADPEPQRVTLHTEDKLALVATYYAPKDAKQRAPGAVLVHGLGSSRKEVGALAARLRSAGFATLTVDLRGHGESATDTLDWKKLDTEGQARAWAFMPRDVEAGVDFLLGQKGVHSTAVSLVGHGAGCALVARQAKRDERVRNLVLLSPRVDELGATLAPDLVELAGLPVFLGVGKAEVASARQLVDAATRGAAGESSIETSVTKIDASELLTDAKFASDVGRWVKAKSLPGKAAAAKPSH
jgi:alpha-beta hydrolase superfamily lysophospholipase